MKKMVMSARQRGHRLRGWALLLSGGLMFVVIACAVAQRPRTVSTEGQETGREVIKLVAGGAFQTALNNAQPGDTIVLEAGATYVGPFVLPLKRGAEYITIQSSRLADLPLEGQRVSPAHNSLMPKLVSPGSGEAALRTAPGAHHYKLVGLEVAPATETAMIYDLVSLGEGGETQRTIDSVPHHITLDRCYVHAYAEQSLKRGVALNSASTEIVNSYIAGFKVVGQDSQAIAGWNGPGPYRIANNYLEAAGENLMFGGAPAAIPNLVPTDIEIRNNYFYKPTRWRIGDPSYGGTPWSVKNLFELKTGRGVIVDGNVFENNWAHAQSGFAILFNCIDDTGSWARIEDVTLTNNIVRHSGNGLNLLGRHDKGASAARITIRNNLLEDISTRWGGSGILFQLLRGTPDVTIEHNTAFQDGSLLVLDGEPHERLRVINNLARHNAYGVFGNDGYIGTAALGKYSNAWTFKRNVIIGLPPDVSSSQYPPDNYFPVSTEQVGFNNRAQRNYRLTATSQYKAKGTDGKDPGCDFDALEAATAWHKK